jgi:polyisoprenoid-binding protein YceI
MNRPPEACPNGASVCSLLCLELPAEDEGLMTLPIGIRGLLRVALLSIGFFAGLRDCLAETYAFDSKHADVRFTYHVGPISQSGHFTELTGLFEYDRRAPERGSISAVIKTASLKADVQEERLKGSDFFNVAVWPEIRFKSRAMRPTAANSAELTGDLTMNGVTQPVTLQMVFETGAAPTRNAAEQRGPRLTATVHILRSSFNMTAMSFLISDEIDIEIDAALRKML